MCRTGIGHEPESVLYSYDYFLFSVFSVCYSNNIFPLDALQLLMLFVGAIVLGTKLLHLIVFYFRIF
jgi:hypothetical protein